jgi:hypothetical protein
MGRNIIIYIILLCILFTFQPISFISAQSSGNEAKDMEQYSEEEFQKALKDYVEKLLVRYGQESLPKELFLVSLMRLVNYEMRQRIVNPRAAVEKYFNELGKQLDELQALKSRLRTSGISELDSYISDLESRMKVTLRSGELDYKKKKVFEDAIQLLYVAEEMIKLDQLSAPGNLDVKISRSKDKLLNAFGEVGETYDVSIDVTPTIFHLFDEWKKIDLYKYESRLIDVKIARSNLIKSGTIESISRMFNQHLRYGYESFNYFEYDLADRLFEDLIEIYSAAGVKDFEDIYFYWAESNFPLERFLRAEKIYSDLLNHYPNTIYLSRVLSRLIQISYTLEKHADVLKYYAQYQTVASPNEEDYYDIQFMAALTSYESVDYNKAIDILISFPKNNPYYNFSQYLIGSIYASGQNYDLANDVFLSLTTSRGTPPEIHSKSLYKLALMSYQRGDYITAIKYASDIPESYTRFDKVLNILAWSYFMLEENRNVDPASRDYSQAIFFAQTLLDEFYSSEHRMDCQGLIAYIYQLEDKPSLALKLYQDVYDAKVKKNEIVQYLQEEDSLHFLYDQAVVMEETALRKNDRTTYSRASKLSESLQQKIWDMELGEISPIGTAVTKEITEILDQLEELQKLRELAKEEENKRVIAKIDSMMLRLTAVLDLFPEKYLKDAVSFNWFDGYPVSRKIADYEFNIEKHDYIKENIIQERNLINSHLAVLYREVERASLQRDYKRMITIEQKIKKLTEIKKKYDQLYTEAYGLSPGQYYSEFDQWGDFGAFGIIDVNFGQRDRLQKNMAEVSGMYNSLMEELSDRRDVVEDKMKKIEAEIRFMTMKARLEERQRLRAEREQSFRETYFDKRTSEFEER